ncbi:MAG: XRE family transcriptional regulator, partial [Clostridia bacterium]|nr:XRE family transcriptional regulator [Clostridia bacterium]
IGKQYVPEVKVKDLTQIVLEMLSSLNSLKKKQELLIEITADGKIDNAELEDFVYIQKELERISIAVETLQLWAEQMIAEGKIDFDQYNAIKGK